MFGNSESEKKTKHLLFIHPKHRCLTKLAVVNFVLSWARKLDVSGEVFGDSGAIHMSKKENSAAVVTFPNVGPA